MGNGEVILERLKYRTKGLKTTDYGLLTTDHGLRNKRLLTTGLLTTGPSDGGEGTYGNFGGSQGARIFNHNLPIILPELLNAVPGLTVLHQSGARHFRADHGHLASSSDPELGCAAL